MVCNKCKNIISESSLKCPYCGNKIAEDYFGYQRAADAVHVRQAQPQKKDNSGKIVLIVLSAVGGLFAIICMLLFAFSGIGGSDFSSGNTGMPAYDAYIEVNNDFEFSVSDDSDEKSDYTILVRSLSDDRTDGFQVSSGETVSKSYSDSDYAVIVMRGYNDIIRINMAVSDTYNFTSIDVDFDDRKILVLGNDGTSGVADGDSTDDNDNAEQTTTSVDSQDGGNDGDGQQNNSNSGDSSNNNSSDKFYALTGVSYIPAIENGYTETISYEMTPDGYKMTIDHRDCDGITYSAFFDYDKRLTTVWRYSLGEKIISTYEYDSNNNLIKEIISTPAGNGTIYEYTYNNDGQLTNLYRHGTSGPAHEICYEYSGPQLQKKYYLNGGLSGYKYDYADGEVSEITYYSTNTNEVYTKEFFTYNSLKNISSYKEIDYDSSTGNSTVVTEYDYIYNGNILNVVGGFKMLGDERIDFEKRYSYDNNGNVTKIYENATNYTIEQDFTYSYISAEYDGLLNEFCMKYHEKTMNMHYFGIGYPHGIY